MHFSNVIFAAASLATVAVAQSSTATPSAPAAPASEGGSNMVTNFGITTKAVQAGQKYTVEWTNEVGSTISVNLRSGDPLNLGKPIPLCADATNTGSCTFTLPKNVESGDDFTIETCVGSKCNYSPMFSVAGGTGAAADSDSEDATATATETGLPSLSSAPKDAETVTGTPEPTLATEVSAYASATETEESNAKETEAEETDSAAKQTANAPEPNEGSVARSSSLAMALCVMAAVLYLN